MAAGVRTHASLVACVACSAGVPGAHTLSVSSVLCACVASYSPSVRGMVW